MPDVLRDQECDPAPICGPEADMSRRPGAGPSGIGRKILSACRYIEGCDDRIPTLSELSDRVELSPHYLHRSFKRLLGVTPRQYADARRVERLKGRLRDGGPITSSLYAVGYGSSSRLYEGAAGQLGMTPATYRRGGAGVEIRYAIVGSPLGRLLVAGTSRGVCRVSLGRTVRELSEDLQREFPNADLHRDGKAVAPWIEALVDYLRGELPPPELPVDVRATAFQRRVWEALRSIPPGQTQSYAEVARRIGQPRAVRAVASACARNPVALVIPCHRVVRKDGEPGGYRWGEDRKRALLELERPR
ncbi:MAG: methylated-DNA--[protein]-cysteine S-methyltransferase [Myxococcota bacterium]